MTRPNTPLDTARTRRGVRALCLFSGGLDSQLAVCLLREQGVEVQAVAFHSPFFLVEGARLAAQRLDVVLHERDFTADILSLLQRPRHGFGKGLNPCRDCHALMLRRAGDLMEEWGCDFLATGEVLNERPFSQTRQALLAVAYDSGYSDLVVRPLSAMLLPPTRPERLGWIDRSRLAGISGRCRKPQMALAARYGIRNYPTPAGGCRLTDPNYCRRLDDLMRHEGLGDPRALALLRYGRHFRLTEKAKLILGRDERENSLIETAARPEDTLLKARDITGPMGLLPAGAESDTEATAAAICARYCDGHSHPLVWMSLRTASSTKELLVTPATDAEMERWRI